MFSINSARSNKFRCIDQANLEKLENYWKYPGSYKQTYLTIRTALDRQFKMIQRVKFPVEVST